MILFMPQGSRRKAGRRQQGAGRQEQGKGRQPAAEPQAQPRSAVKQESLAKLVKFS